VYKEYQRYIEYTSNKNSITYAKLQFFDPEKWRKKFKLLFDREKIIDFKPPLTMQMTFDQNQQQLNAKSLLGQEILQSGKFWLLFLSFCKVKLLKQRIESITEPQLIAHLQPPVVFLI